MQAAPIYDPEPTGEKMAGKGIAILIHNNKTSFLKNRS
jgi:hypothetical protein